MANNILVQKGNKIGNSIREENCEEIVDDIFKASRNYSCKITYPEDVLVEKTWMINHKSKNLMILMRVI